ncbi:C2H2-type domain-containing protein [[Candida] zeylanoides]
MSATEIERAPTAAVRGAPASSTPSPAKSATGADDDALDAHGAAKRPAKGRVFQCTGYPDCSMSFTRSEHLARHKRKHTGERPFTCPHCSKNFSRLDNLRQHKQTVHAYEAFSDQASPAPHMLQPPRLGDASNPVTPCTAVFSSSNPASSCSSAGSYAMASPPSRYFTPASSSSPHASGAVLKPLNVRERVKRRPRPLSLSHSFYGPPHSQPPSQMSLPPPYVRQPLYSAPIVPTHNTLVYGPKSASLTPSTVSPLSPLFHHSFSQTISAGPYQSSQLSQPIHPSARFGSHQLPSLAPPALAPPALASPAVVPVADSSSSSSSSTPPVRPGPPDGWKLPRPVSAASAAPSRAAAPAPDRRHWLRGVLNEAPPSETVSQPLKVESRKPTINSLLSPY